MFDLIPTRVAIGVMLLLAMIMLFAMRTNMSLTILAMVQPPMLQNATMHALPDFGPRYNWSASDQSLVLGAFYWGYDLSMIPLGILTDRFALGRLNIGGALLSLALLTIVTPLAAAHSLWLTLCLRFAMGVFSGGTVPAVQRLIAKWSPPNEKSRFTMAMCGLDLGTVVAWSLCSVCIESAGWRWTFYGSGSIGLAVTLLWFHLVRDSPAEHPRIAPAELEHIRSSQKGVQHRSQRWPPLGQIARSLPIWMMLCAQFGNLWGWHFQSMAVPRFLYEVLGFDMVWTGTLASLTHVVRPFSGLAFAMAADALIGAGWLPVARFRKSFMVFSHLLAGGFMMLIAIIDFGPYAAPWCVLLIMISTMLNGATYVTSGQLGQDLAPNFAGSLCAICNTISSTSGFLAPMLIAYVTRQSNGMPEWMFLFGFTGAVYIVTGGLFMCFGTVKIQPWNEQTDKVNGLEMNARNTIS